LFALRTLGNLPRVGIPHAERAMKKWDFVIVRRCLVIGVVAGRLVVPPPVGALGADPRPSPIDTTTKPLLTT